MELSTAVPFPTLVFMSAMQIATSISCPFRLYPYMFIGLSPPEWVITTLFVTAVFCTTCKSVGVRKAAALHIILIVTALIDIQRACLLAATYFVFVHTPIHMTVCYRRGQRMSLALTVWLMVSTAAILRVMRPRGNLVLTYQMQKLVVAHTLTEWRVADWFTEWIEERSLIRHHTKKEFSL